MKNLLLLSALLGMVASAHAAELVLLDGRKFANGRVVAISGEIATIAHAGGITQVATDAVDLETLARAHQAIQAKEADAAKTREAAAKSIAAKDAARRDEIAVRRAEAEMRERAAANAPKAPSPKKAAQAGPTIEQLKASFPAKVSGSARVFIPQSGQGGKAYIVSSTLTEISGGGSVASASTRTNMKGRFDSIQYDAPPEDMWRWYRSTLSTTTRDALPRTLQMIDARLAEDVQKMQRQRGGSAVSGQAQAEHTLHWIEKELKPHLAQWRRLL